LRHGLDFDHLQAYEGTVSADGFYATVPDHYTNCTYYYQEYILSSPSMNGTFLPTVMSNMTAQEDCVFFKIYIYSGEIEQGTVDFILSSSEDNQHTHEGAGWGGGHTKGLGGWGTHEGAGWGGGTHEGAGWERGTHPLQRGGVG